MSSTATHRDPTYEGARRLELAERNCAICVHRGEALLGARTCRNGLRWPGCLVDRRRGFREDLGDA